MRARGTSWPRTDLPLNIWTHTCTSTCACVRARSLATRLSTGGVTAPRCRCRACGDPSSARRRGRCRYRWWSVPSLFRAPSPHRLAAHHQTGARRQTNSGSVAAARRNSARRASRHPRIGAYGAGARLRAGWCAAHPRRGACAATGPFRHPTSGSGTRAARDRDGSGMTRRRVVTRRTRASDGMHTATPVARGARLATTRRTRRGGCVCA